MRAQYVLAQRIYRLQWVGTHATRAGHSGVPPFTMERMAGGTGGGAASGDDRRYFYCPVRFSFDRNVKGAFHSFPVGVNQFL